ncbi:hypothetical protein M9458_026714, partial [Cirrhinus mrigala]
MYVFGGFSGVILNDVLVYKPASCEAFFKVDLCQSSFPGNAVYPGTSAMLMTVCLPPSALHAP